MGWLTHHSPGLVMRARPAKMGEPSEQSHQRTIATCDTVRKGIPALPIGCSTAPEGRL